MPGPGHQCSASNWLDTRFSSRLVTSLRSMTSRRAPAIYNRGPKGLPEEITTLRSTARSLDSRAYLHGLIMVGRKVGIGILPCRKMSTCSLDIFGPCHPGTSSAITVFPVQIQRWSTMFSWHKVSVMNVTMGTVEFSEVSDLAPATSVQPEQLARHQGFQQRWFLPGSFPSGPLQHHSTSGGFR